jgi:hypothetical protein
MGKPNSHQPLELWNVHTSKSGIEALPKHVIKEYVLDIHNCVGTPQISSKDHQGDVVVRQTKTNSLTMEPKWLEYSI